MKLCVMLLAVLWGLILMSEPALASCTYQTYTIDGRTVTCQTCCYGAAGCQTVCN